MTNHDEAPNKIVWEVVTDRHLEGHSSDGRYELTLWGSSRGDAWTYVVRDTRKGTVSKGQGQVQGLTAALAEVQRQCEAQ